MRDEFGAKTKETLARRVAYRCSNPKCELTTSGPQKGGPGAINLGVAAHITAASSEGPRYDVQMTAEQRSSIENGIWLCQACARLIDSDPVHYTVELLQTWKASAEAKASRALEERLHLALDRDDAWQLVTQSWLDGLPSLSKQELIRYFDGAEPDWRHALSNSIPRREVVADLVSGISASIRDSSGCTARLIRAAGGEGKSTLLLQTAADLAQTLGCSCLWRKIAVGRVSPRSISDLDDSQQWLVVIDDADNAVRDLVQTAQLLASEGRDNVHFLLAARDADWINQKGDRQPWDRWLTWVREPVLKGITHADATAIVEAWAGTGDDGLRGLKGHDDTSERAQVLCDAVRDAENAQQEQARGRRPIDGSFFGGLLAVRFDQAGLQAHVRTFLERLSEVGIPGGLSTLFDALLFVAACHAAGLIGIDGRVLADLIGCDDDRVQTTVVRPLGAEAMAAYSAGHVMTRHSRVAAAVLLEAETAFGVDLAELWTRIVRQTVATSRYARVSHETHPKILHAGPGLLSSLPSQLGSDAIREVAVAAAQAAVESQTEWLGCVVDLGKTHRLAGEAESANAVFRDALAGAREKADHNRVIRGFWYEWSVCNGDRDMEHALANAWLGGVSLSDHLNPAPISDRQILLSSNGLGVAFRKLSSLDLGDEYARALRAAATIGDEYGSRYADRYHETADHAGAPSPNGLSEAVDWLATGVRRAASESSDLALENLAPAPQALDFESLRKHLSKRVR